MSPEDIRPNRLIVVKRVAAVVAVFATMAGLAGATDDLKPITPAEAIKQIGKPKVVVEMKVAKAKDRVEKRGVIFLDSEDDFKSAANLGIAISAEAKAKFRAKGVPDPAAHFQGKTIRVTGCVMRFEERPYLPVYEPDQIAIVGKK